MRNKRYFRLFHTCLVSMLIIIGLAPVGASSANISHSYKSLAAAPNGSLVSLSATKTSYIELANDSNANKLLGISVASNDSLLAVDATSGAIQVATEGTASTLVSNLNDNISVGDQIAVSPFNGIGMKALPGSRVIGLAQTAFDGSLGKSELVVNKQGKTSTIKVGFVRVNIGITTISTQGNTSQPNNVLQKFAISLTGHQISTWRLTISAVVTLVAFIVLATLIYAAIYGSIVSVGRNPLAKYTILRTLRAVIGMALLIAVLTSLTVYLLLR